MSEYGDSELEPGFPYRAEAEASSGPSSGDGNGDGDEGFEDQEEEDQDAYEDEDEDRDEDENTKDEDRDGDRQPAPPPPPHDQNFFAPPFYGRPPTPLPPSPSLTSLLRPSRPTTPDATDDELEPVPRASPKVPTYEYYGFALYLLSTLSFVIYLLWAYLPSPFLHALGIFYYPNRWWALAVPAYLVMLLVYIYVALAAYNTEILTLPLSSVETIVDEAANIAVIEKCKGGHFRSGERDGSGNAEAGGDIMDWREVWNESTDGVMDVPLAGVNKVLYGYVENDQVDF